MIDPVNVSNSQSPSTPQSPAFIRTAGPIQGGEPDPGGTITPQVLYGARGDDGNGNPITAPILQGRDRSLSVEFNPNSQAAMAANFTNLVNAINNIPTIAHGDGTTITTNSPFSRIGPVGDGSTITNAEPFSTIGASGTTVILKSPSGTYTDVHLRGVLLSRTAST